MTKINQKWLIIVRVMIMVMEKMDERGIWKEKAAGSGDK